MTSQGPSRSMLAWREKERVRERERERICSLLSLLKDTHPKELEPHPYDLI
jgi:hypothetical protein